MVIPIMITVMDNHGNSWSLRVMAVMESHGENHGDYRRYMVLSATNNGNIWMPISNKNQSDEWY